MAKLTFAISDWTPIPPIVVINKVFARVFTRVYVGAELCGDDWVALSLEYTHTIMKTQQAMALRYHPWFYSLAKYLSPEVKNLNSLRKKGGQMIKPVLDTRSHPGLSEKQAKPQDAIQWLMDFYAGKGKKASPDDIIQDIFVTIVASLHNTAMVGLSLLFDLLDHPEYLEEIRAEIARVQSREPGKAWTRRGLAELHVLNACMRENMRLHSFNIGMFELHHAAFLNLSSQTSGSEPSKLEQTELTRPLAGVQRLAMTPFTFEDGLHIPKDTSIGFTTDQLNLDPDLYSNADNFDPSRWLTEQPDTENKNQFASTNDHWLGWGSGHHSCPGRFLADVSLKMFIAQLLTNYDIKWASKDQRRPADNRHNFLTVPNMELPILFKERVM